MIDSYHVSSYSPAAAVSALHCQSSWYSINQDRIALNLVRPVRLGYCFLTWGVEGQGLSRGALVRMVSGEELVVETRRGTVAEFELSVGGGEVGEPRRRLVQSRGTQVHGEPPHLARAAEERTSAHWCQLLQSPLLAPFVLEPYLK
jgi:hypothetical protein